MKCEPNLTIEQLQLIKLIENINQKYRQRCNIDKNKVLSDTNLKLLKSILPGLIILYKWNQEKQESSINLEELIDQQLIKYRRLQNILNKKINKTPTDKSNYNLFRKDKNLIRLEYLAKIIKFISQEKTIQKKIRDLKVSENDCMAILNKLNKLSYRINKTCSKEKLHTSKYLSAILNKHKSLETSGINYLEDTHTPIVTKSQLNAVNESDRNIIERRLTVTNALHTTHMNKEEQEKQDPLEGNESETLLMYENKDKTINDSSDDGDGSCDTCGYSTDTQSVYSSSIFVTCNENDDTNNTNQLMNNITSNIIIKVNDEYDNDNKKIQKRKKLINDYSYILSIHNGNNIKNNDITTTTVQSRTQIECNCIECQEDNWMRLRGGKTNDSICFCPQCLCQNCARDSAKENLKRGCNCNKPCTCNPCGDTTDIEEILNHRALDSVKLKDLKDAQPIFLPCSCPKDQCPCNPCNDPQRNKPKCKCDCAANACRCNPCKCTPCNDPACNINKFQCFCPDCECNPCTDATRKKTRSVCDDTTCENQPKPLVCACPNCECNPCTDPTCKKSKSKCNDLKSIKSACNCNSNACKCNPCRCDPCNDPSCNKPKCNCPPGDGCKCNPCVDPTRAKQNKCYCPESFCPCDPCTDPTRTKAKKCFCPEEFCQCEKCSDPARAKYKKYNCPKDSCLCNSCNDLERTKPTTENHKCSCPEDSCLCSSCGDPKRVERAAQAAALAKQKCFCPEEYCPCEKCSDPTRVKPKKCNCPEDSCPCDDCQDHTRIKPKKCTCPEKSCPCDSCNDPKRAAQVKQANKNDDLCRCPEESCPCDTCADPTCVKPKKCSCPEGFCSCENCGDPERAKKKCLCPEECVCEDCQDPTRKKICSCPDAYCPCESCGDAERAARNKQNHKCSCPEDACLCTPCEDPARIRRNLCSCPKGACSCENCGDPTRRKLKNENYPKRKKQEKKCNCDDNACTCNQCLDPTRQNKNKCFCTGECTCNPCDDPTMQSKSLRNDIKQCDCIGECNCKPCSDPTKQLCTCKSCTCTTCTDPRFKKDKYYCTCKSCLCIECADPKITKKYCTCQPHCDCKYCSLPKKTFVHSVTSLYKSAVSIVCDRISAYMNKTCTVNDACTATNKDKEVCIIYQQNKHPECECDKCLCDPCCPTNIPEPPPPPLPTDILCVCDVGNVVTDNDNDICNKILPIDCTCDECTCDPCVPPSKSLPDDKTCTCTPTCKCCGTCNKSVKERLASSVPLNKNEICLMEGCTCKKQCCCEPCTPKPKNMNKCKCFGTCACNACAKTKKQLPESCTCDICNCDPCKPKVKDVSKCVCGQDTCDCDACLNMKDQPDHLKQRSSRNTTPTLDPCLSKNTPPTASKSNANKHNEECTCQPFCDCDRFQNKTQTGDTKILCECYQCKCQKWQNNDSKHEFCCICDDKNNKCDFKCTCGEHCPCETTITVPVKDTLLTSDCTCNPCTCDPCFTKESKMNKIISTQAATSNKNDTTLPCSCQPVCRCGECFDENVTQVYSYSDKRIKEQACDSVNNNTMIIKADEIQINEICECCKCPDRNIKTRHQQQQTKTSAIMRKENDKKICEKLQENKKKIEKQEEKPQKEQKQRIVAVIKSVCDKTEQNKNKKQRVVAVINSSCQKTQQKIEIQEEQQRVVAVINSRSYKPIQNIEDQESRSKAVKSISRETPQSICDKQQRMVQICLNKIQTIEPFKKEQIVAPFKKEQIGAPCKEEQIGAPCKKEQIVAPCKTEQIEEPYQIARSEEPSYSCDNEGYTSLKANICVKLKSKFHCFKAYFGDYFSELIKSHTENEDGDECTCDICKCRLELHANNKHKSTLTQDSIVSNDSKKQKPCCPASTPKSEQCLAIINNSKKTLSCPSRKTIRYNETCLAKQVDLEHGSAQGRVNNTNTRGLGTSSNQDEYYSENVRKEFKSIDSHEENLIWTRTSSKEKQSSFIELYDYKDNNNKGLQGMLNDDDYCYDNDNHDILSQTYSPVYHLERKYNQQLRINNSDSSVSSNPMKKYTHQQIYCVDIKNDTTNLKAKQNQRNAIDQSAYLFKNIKSLHSSVTDLDENEWEHRHNEKFDKKIIRTNHNLLTTNEYKFCKSIDTIELQHHFEHESSYTTAIKSITTLPSNENNLYFINMQGVVPMSNNMDYKYKYVGQPIMLTLSGQLSGKLSESRNNLHSSIDDLDNDEYERFVTDSKKVGINIPFVRKTKQSCSKNLKRDDSNHIPQREHENLRKTLQNEKSESVQSNRLNSQINDTNSKSIKRDDTSYRHYLKNKARTTKPVNQFKYSGSIRKRGGTIPKDNIKDDHSRKTESKETNLYDSWNDERENLRGDDGNKYHEFESSNDQRVVNNEKTSRSDNLSDFIPELKSSDSIYISDNDEEKLDIKQSSCYGSSLSFNDRIYDHEKIVNEDNQSNNNKSDKTIDELYLNEARNDNSKRIDAKKDLIATVSSKTNKISICSANTNTPPRSMSLGGITSRNSMEYNRLENDNHFARGGGYNPKVDNRELNDTDGKRGLQTAFSGIIGTAISDIPETGRLSENQYYSVSNLNYTSTTPMRRSSPIYIDEYILSNKHTGLNAPMLTSEMATGHNEYNHSIDSENTEMEFNDEKRECVAKKALDDIGNCDKADNTEKLWEHDAECTCRICVCGDCNCKICECEKGVKEEYERVKKQKEETAEKAKYCTCYICECNACCCTNCECNLDKFPQGIPLSKIVCPCTNCNCGIKCKDGTLLKPSKFFMNRDNDLFKIPDNLNQDIKVKILNAVQNVNVDIKFAIKNANLQVAEAMHIADKMVQDTVLKLCKMDIEIKDVRNALQNPVLIHTSPDLSNNEFDLLISDDEHWKGKYANKHIIGAVGKASNNLTDALYTANKNLEAAMLFLLPVGENEDNTSFTEAKGAINDSENQNDNTDNQQSSNNDSNDRRKGSSKKGNCDCEYPCKCEDCPDQPHEPPPCDCTEPCECVGCPTLNIPVKEPHCRCKTCLCDPCTDKKRKKGSPIAKKLCGCTPECICSKCPAKPGCECEGECVCPVCPHKERKCECAICLCNDCAAFKQVQQLCDCPQCLCSVCEKGGGLILTKPPKLIYNPKCKCAVCLCENCTSDKIKPSCSCAVCLCDKCPEMEGKLDFECTCYPQCTCDKCSDPNVKCVSKRKKEEPYKCTCAICYCEKCSDPTKKRQDPCPKEHPKDCTCQKCNCSPCLSKKHKISECKCEKCKCSPCKMAGGMLKDCKCETCECLECKYKTANIEECTCKICECNKKPVCQSNTLDSDALTKIAITECTCDPCNCNPCLASNGLSPKCKCPHCMCDKCQSKPLATCNEADAHPPDCKCNVCYCAPCKYDTDPNCDQTFRLSSCTCEVCSCKPCKAKGDSCDETGKQLTLPSSCTCLKCDCFPCILQQTKKRPNIVGTLPKCLCDICKCNPCMAAPPNICNEPREPPPYTPDCSCPKCYCESCKGKDPVNPCDLMKIDTTVVCTCDPCNCDSCKLPSAKDPRLPKLEHPDTCQCAVCTCTSCELPNKTHDSRSIPNHPDDCQCNICNCKPCKLKPDYESPIDRVNQGPQCRCKLCCCNPCKLLSNYGCTEHLANLPDCICTVCNCDPCKAKPKDCQTCPDCFGKGDCKCLNCLCIPCTKTRPQDCNCTQCHCTNCLSSFPSKFIPNCNCLQCLCKQHVDKSIMRDETSPCKPEVETKKCPEICPLNAINKKTGRKKCACSICYCNPCQPVESQTKFQYTFKPPENNPLHATLQVDEQKDCTCDPCLCRTCPKKMNQKQCNCLHCKCDNCLMQQKNDGNDICKCPRPCPCISCKGRGGAGSGNITTANIDHVRGGGATSNNEMQSVDGTDDVDLKCSCTDPCVCQSCAGKKYQDMKKCHCPTPCTCEHCPDTYNKTHLCTCKDTCTCKSCLAAQHKDLLKCNPKGECSCIEPCCCIECSGTKHLNQTDNNECTCKNICTCETCIAKSNERRKLLNQARDEIQVPCDCEKPCTCAVCPGNSGKNFIYPFGPFQNQKQSQLKAKTDSIPIPEQTTIQDDTIISTCYAIPNITPSKCTTIVDKESHVTCRTAYATYGTMQDNEAHNAICTTIQDNKSQLQTNYNFDDEMNKIMITETMSNNRKLKLNDKPPCACTSPCVSACLMNSSHHTNKSHDTNNQTKPEDGSIVKRMANQISSLVTKPFTSSTATTSNHPSKISTAINNLLNCNCPIPCLCSSRDQCGTYTFMNTPEKDTSTKRSCSNITRKRSSKKTQLDTKQSNGCCDCIGVCNCLKLQICNIQKQVSETKYPSNKNSPIDTRFSDTNNFSRIYQPQRTCDCVGLCKCGRSQKPQEPSSSITKRISKNIKQIKDSCKTEVSKIISSKSQSTQFRIFETRKLTKDSLLLKWTPATIPCLTGYEVDVNGSLSHRIRNKDRCVAVLFNICFNKPVNISVFAMSNQNRNHPPAITTLPC